jgi:DNA-directed RNA polymerase subunit K/omega
MSTKYTDEDDEKNIPLEDEDEEDEDEDRGTTSQARRRVLMSGAEDDDAIEDADDDEDEDEDDDEDEDLDDEDPELEDPDATIPAPPGMNFAFTVDDEDDDTDDDEEEDENYLQKFDENMKKNIITEYYPELQQHNSDEVEVLCQVVRDKQGRIIDPLHQSLPFITKYEKARVLGERAKQINAGATPLVDVEPNVIDGYLIAMKEFHEKKIPFILKRPIGGNRVEYWKLADLEIIG